MYVEREPNSQSAEKAQFNIAKAPYPSNDEKTLDTRFFFIYTNIA